MLKWYQYYYSWAASKQQANRLPNRTRKSNSWAASKQLHSPLFSLTRKKREIHQLHALSTISFQPNGSSRWGYLATYLGCGPIWAGGGRRRFRRSWAWGGRPAPPGRPARRCGSRRRGSSGRRRRGARCARRCRSGCPPGPSWGSASSPRRRTPRRPSGRPCWTCPCRTPPVCRCLKFDQLRCNIFSQLRCNIFRYWRAWWALTRPWQPRSDPRPRPGWPSSSSHSSWASGDSKGGKKETNQPNQSIDRPGAVRDTLKSWDRWFHQPNRLRWDGKKKHTWPSKLSTT
jgi:hypothetical protein